MTDTELKNIKYNEKDQHSSSRQIIEVRLSALKQSWEQGYQSCYKLHGKPLHQLFQHSSKTFAGAKAGIDSALEKGEALEMPRLRFDPSDFPIIESGYYTLAALDRMNVETVKISVPKRDAQFFLERYCGEEKAASGRPSTISPAPR